MGKANLLILAAVALFAVVFLIIYLQPADDVPLIDQGDAPEGDVVGSSEVREILLLEALNHNITISEREREFAYLGLLNKSGLSNESYQEYLITEHGSMEVFKKNLEENLIVLKLINTEVDWSRIKMDNATVDSYIAQNPQLFPLDQLSDPIFKDQFYKMAKQQMFEKQRQQLVSEYIRDIVQKNQVQ